MRAANTQPKFILTKDGTLRLGMVKRHLELLKAGESCIGGGYYKIDTLSPETPLATLPMMSMKSPALGSRQISLCSRPSPI